MRCLEKTYDTLPQTEIADLSNQDSATTYVLDLRPTDEFNNVHLPGAHNIPFNEIVVVDFAVMQIWLAMN